MLPFLPHRLGGQRSKGLVNDWNWNCDRRHGHSLSHRCRRRPLFQRPRAISGSIRFGPAPFAGNLGQRCRTGDAVGPPLNCTTRLVVTTMAGGFVLLAALLVIGVPRGHEVKAYHLPSAVNFFRDASLRIWDKTLLHAFPANASL